MSYLERLQKAKTLIEFAPLLGYTPSGLSYILYKLRPETLYTSFNIPKKAGGVRSIHAPKAELKLLQARLARLLSLCLDEIEEKYKVRKLISHGFRSGRSIVTNADMHRRKRYVFNIDIVNFFESINFGRVRGFLIKDRDFNLDPAVATIVAQIACYNNILPQGSPCSPVISNLIASILDRRLLALAKKFGCTYTRYADDITFSTNEKKFPRSIAASRFLICSKWRVGRPLKNEVVAAGFAINPLKTRMQIVGSRQTATGLVVELSPNLGDERGQAAAV